MTFARRGSGCVEAGPGVGSVLVCGRLSKPGQRCLVVSSACAGQLHQGFPMPRSQTQWRVGVASWPTAKAARGEPTPAAHSTGHCLGLSPALQRRRAWPSQIDHSTRTGLQLGGSRHSQVPRALRLRQVRTRGIPCKAALFASSHLLMCLYRIA